MRACQLCLREIVSNRRELAIDHSDLFVVNQTIYRIARYLAFAEDKHHFGLRDDAATNRHVVHNLVLRVLNNGIERFIAIHPRLADHVTHNHFVVVAPEEHFDVLRE